MDVDRGDERYRRPSAASFEGIVFYVDDFSAATTTGRDPSSKMYDRPEDVYELSVASDESRAIPQPSGPDSFGLQPENRSALYPAYLPGERACCQTSGPRRSRSNLDVDQRSSRRSSVQSSRSRANSCSGRPTPLGDDRRASVCKKARPRRASTASRKDSARSAKADAKRTQKTIADTQELEQTRRHRRIAMIVLGTFVFLLVASILVVVVTLTHSTFLSPVTGSKELAEHRAQLRKENEELLNSLNRDISVPENVTAPP